MAEFRKAGSRTYYRVDGESVIRIVNMETISQVDAGKNAFIICDAMEAGPCTEQEFTDQFNLALERITKMNIV